MQHTSCAVLRPGSVEDISRMIRYCRRYDLKVGVRGQAHTMYGQTLSSGLVIENGSLNKIHSIGPDGADVDAGVRMKDLILAAYPAFVEEMVARNRRLFEKARSVGATRYPIGVLPFTQQDWVQQYGPLWAEFAARKRCLQRRCSAPRWRRLA